MTKPGVSAPNDHISEKQLDSYIPDVHYFNDGSLEDLYNNIERHLAIQCLIQD